MKNASFAAALSFFFFFFFQGDLFAQKMATWKGGTPGRASDWACAANWKEGRVPNEFSRVVIPVVTTSTFSNPVLANGELEIWSLEIHSGASLYIGKNARLFVLEHEEHGPLALGEGFVRQDIYPDSSLVVAR